MNELRNAMKSAHGRSFFLYSNGIVSPMKAMFVHEIDISGHSMTDVIRLLENAVEATGIVQRFVLLLVKHVL
jgi:hypothetical protein